MESHKIEKYFSNLSCGAMVVIERWGEELSEMDAGYTHHRLLLDRSLRCSPPGCRVWAGNLSVTYLLLFSREPGVWVVSSGNTCRRNVSACLPREGEC